MLVMNSTLARQLARPAKTKMVMLVMDGAGGLPHPKTGKTELQTANIPNLNQLAKEGMSGCHFGVAPGVTSGSGPGHLVLFGYPPDTKGTERGVLETLGIDIALEPGEIAARGNFVTLDPRGIITDRRAGRPKTEENKRVCDIAQQALDRMDFEEPVTARIYPVREHRVSLLLTSGIPGLLSGHLQDSDPQITGVKPLKILEQANLKDDQVGSAIEAAVYTNYFIDAMLTAIKEEPVLNGLVFRGFGTYEVLETLTDIYGIRALAIASAPMYRGVAKLVGMDVVPLDEKMTLEREMELLQSHWEAYDFFFVHVKKTDSYAEDGNFDGKVAEFEKVDQVMVPAIRALGPDAWIVTGDHSTPSVMKAHNWNAVPTIFWAPENILRNNWVEGYNELACARGLLGPMFDPKTLITMMMNQAGRLKKYGA